MSNNAVWKSDSIASRTIECNEMKTFLYSAQSPYKMVTCTLPPTLIGSVVSFSGSDYQPNNIRHVVTCTDPIVSEVANHYAYLGKMFTTGVVSSEVAAKARKVMELARKSIRGLPVPASVAYDGGPIHYTWDNDRHQVTTEISADGTCEWYVSDRETGQFEGGEFELVNGLPLALVAGLKNILV